MILIKNNQKKILVDIHEMKKEAKKLGYKMELLARKKLFFEELFNSLFTHSTNVIWEVNKKQFSRP